MTKDDLRTKLMGILEEAAPTIDASGFEADKSFEDQELDSLDQVNFLLGIEEELGLKIEDEQAAELPTLNAFVDHIHPLL